MSFEVSSYQFVYILTRYIPCYATGCIFHDRLYNMFWALHLDQNWFGLCLSFLYLELSTMGLVFVHIPFVLMLVFIVSASSRDPVTLT